MLKQCNDCRSKLRSYKNNRPDNIKKNKKRVNQEWKKDNKQRIADYNKYYREKHRKKKTEKKVVKLKKVGSETWDYTFDSLAAAGRELGIHRSNICKVIKGEISATGGYVAKYEIVKLENPIKPSEKNNVQYLFT